MAKFPIRHKFKAKPTNYDGFRYDSKLEARYANHLDMLKKSGEVLFYLRQVPLHLAPGSTYRLDFMVFYKDETVELIDVKGMDTPLSKAKRQIAEDIYPVTIKVVKKGDF